MTQAEAWLLRAAKEAREYLDNKVRGTGLNGMYDDIAIGRNLTDAIYAVEQEEQQAREAEQAAQFFARR